MSGIGWTLFAAAKRIQILNKNLSIVAKQENLGEIQPFTGQSTSGGNKRKKLLNPVKEWIKVLREIAEPESHRSHRTEDHLFKLIKHQLDIELSSELAFSSPSKSFIISQEGQYFYKNTFTKLFNPITRGYKIDERQQRHSTYSFFRTIKWVYHFIQYKF